MSVRFDLENEFNEFLSTTPPSTVSSLASFHFRREVENLSPILTEPDSPLEVSQTALEVNQYVSSTLPILSSQQANSSQSPQPLFPNSKVGKLLELYDNEFRLRFIGAVTPALFSQAFSDFLERYIALNGPSLQQPPIRVRASETLSNMLPVAGVCLPPSSHPPSPPPELPSLLATEEKGHLEKPNSSLRGKRKVQEVVDFSSTITPSQTLKSRPDIPCLEAIVVKKVSPPSLTEQYPDLFKLIIDARNRETLYFKEIQEYLKDNSNVEYKISLFLFLLSKIKPIHAKLLRQALSKEGMNITSCVAEKIPSWSFHGYRRKLIKLIKDEGYFHIVTRRKISYRKMQADFEKIDTHTRFFEKIENEYNCHCESFFNSIDSF